MQVLPSYSQTHLLRDSFRDNLKGMAQRQKYIPRAAPVVAVQLDLDTPGFTYKKWGGEQKCKRGDWLVSNAGDVYTVDQETFRRTYRNVQPGLYKKVSPVWAEVAEQGGTIPTKEGSTDYKAGDYLVFNNEDGSDGYAMRPEVFKDKYTPDAP
jgi:hypothetical protein